MLAGTVGEINPFRYRSYYYDVETGFYYLNSRYYDPKVGRFLNADGILGANGGITGYNLFAYCNNNPVMGYDPSGFAAMAIYKDIYGSLSSPLSPGIGGGRSVAGLVVCAAVTYLITTSPAVTDSKPIALPFPNAAQRAKERALAFSQAKAEEREKAIAEESKKKNQAYFPLNPYEFMPVGLIMSAYPGTKNGRIIQWKDPITKVIMFEWDEAFDQGPHYHALIDKKLGLHDGNHYLPGDKVPEPLNTIYFGGYYGN